MPFSLDTKKEPSKESKPAPNRYANVTIEDTQLGIWRFMVAHEKPRSLKDIKNHVTELSTGYWLTMYRLLADIYSVAPWDVTDSLARTPCKIPSDLSSS
ncbi:hypothetical protein D9611_013623 [Ephemerocybe angulata]|uniref:Uncharacterized protein n=1 Tax=Ephemerocybe angulata TaxID=980116 RepID=A0A8H5ARZ1_9AGAR|nr:hypothetical protein D9611_013623 [Tulosesus angulatus]